MSNELALWDDEEKVKEIRTLFAPTLSQLEFDIFVGMGKATGLNPFRREIWAVKYGKNQKGEPNPAQIFIGRDGYRKVAQSHKDYDFHQSDTVYENDEFEMVNGELVHKYKLTNRGKLIGAYCIAKRHKSSKPHYVFVELEEYNTGQSLWAPPTWKDNQYGGKFKVGGKPATMIKKVAESQCLRGCFQDLLGGTYGEEEFDPRYNQTIDVEPESHTNETQTEKVKRLIINKTGEQDVYKATRSENSSVSNSSNAHTHDASESMENTQTTRENENAPHLVEAREQEVKHTNPSNEGPKATIDQVDLIEELIHETNFEPLRLRKALNHYNVAIIRELSATQADDFIARLQKGN